MLRVRHAPSRGQYSFFLQLQDLAEVLLALFRILRLWFFIMDHKGDFKNNSKCRLINPAKKQPCKQLVSKPILDKVNDTIRTRTMYNQWKSTKSVIDWFNSIRDIRAGTPFSYSTSWTSIPRYPKFLLGKALEFAKRYTTLTDDDIEIIKHSRKTFFVV